MSQVTRAILSFSALEDDIGRLDDVNRVLAIETAGSEFADVSQHVPGHKNFGSLYVATFNHFGSTKLRTALNEVAWKYPKEVQILVQEEEDPAFRSYVLENWVEPPEDRLQRVERELADLRNEHRRTLGFSI